MKDVIRVVKLGHKYYAKNIDLNDEDDIEDVKIFVGEGSPVILISDMEELQNLYDLEFNDVEMV